MPVRPMWSLCYFLEQDVVWGIHGCVCLQSILRPSFNFFSKKKACFQFTFMFWILLKQTKDGKVSYTKIQKFTTPETRFSEPRYSEILNLMNKLQLPFSYFTLYSDSI